MLKLFKFHEFLRNDLANYCCYYWLHSGPWHQTYYACSILGTVASGLKVTQPYKLGTVEPGFQGKKPYKLVTVEPGFQGTLPYKLVTVEPGFQDTQPYKLVTVRPGFQGI